MRLKLDIIIEMYASNDSLKYLHFPKTSWFVYKFLQNLKFLQSAT